MRYWLLLLPLIVPGCGPAPPPPTAQQSGALPPVAVDPAPTEPQGAPAPDSGTQLAPDAARNDPPIEDLRTRRRGDDWPGFLGPTGDGKSRETGIRTDWPAAGPPLVWHRALGEGYAMPTVSLGRLLLFERFGDTARLTALVSETGKALWQFEYPTDYVDFYGFNGGPRCCPVVDGGRVYIYGPEGMLHCIRLVDGAQLWRVDTVVDFGVVQNFFGVGSTPIVEGDLLIVQVGGSPPGSPGIRSGRVQANGSAIVAFDKVTGEVRYRLGDQLASYASPVLATLHGRRWGFAFMRDGLLGFDPAKGTADFFFEFKADLLESVNAANPVVVGDRVFISEAYDLSKASALLRVKPGGYEIVWADDPAKRQKAMRAHWSTPIHLDGYLYGCSGRHNSEAELRCIELASGKVQWSEPGLGWTSLLYADGHFLCLAQDGVLRLIRATPEKYDLVAEVEPHFTSPEGIPTPLITEPAWAAPILAHGLLYVRGNDHLACFELIPSEAGTAP